MWFPEPFLHLPGNVNATIWFVQSPIDLELFRKVLTRVVMGCTNIGPWLASSILRSFERIETQSIILTPEVLERIEGSACAEEGPL